MIAIVLGHSVREDERELIWSAGRSASPRRANLPSLVMLLFWKGTTKQGITAAITRRHVVVAGWILLSGDTFKDVYGLPAESAASCRSASPASSRFRWASWC